MRVCKWNQRKKIVQTTNSIHTHRQQEQIYAVFLLLFLFLHTKIGMGVCKSVYMCDFIDRWIAWQWETKYQLTRKKLFGVRTFDISFVKSIKYTYYAAACSLLLACWLDYLVCGVFFALTQLLALFGGLLGRQFFMAKYYNQIQCKPPFRQSILRMYFFMLFVFVWNRWIEIFHPKLLNDS